MLAQRVLIDGGRYNTQGQCSGIYTPSYFDTLAARHFIGKHTFITTKSKPIAAALPSDVKTINGTVQVMAHQVDARMNQRPLRSSIAQAAFANVINHSLEQLTQ
jgi:hypothetical protein